MVGYKTFDTDFRSGLSSEHKHTSFRLNRCWNNSQLFLQICVNIWCNPVNISIHKPATHHRSEPGDGCRAHVNQSTMVVMCVYLGRAHNVAVCVNSSFWWGWKHMRMSMCRPADIEASRVDTRVMIMYKRGLHLQLTRHTGILDEDIQWWMRVFSVEWCYSVEAGDI